MPNAHGLLHSDSQMIFAVPSTLWENNGEYSPEWCGKTVNVTNLDSGVS
jgi:hypothetical protein